MYREGRRNLKRVWLRLTTFLCLEAVFRYRKRSKMQKLCWQDNKLKKVNVLLWIPKFICKAAVLLFFETYVIAV